MKIAKERNTYSRCTASLKGGSRCPMSGTGSGMVCLRCDAGSRPGNSGTGEFLSV